MELKVGMCFRTKKGIIRKWSEYDKLIKDWDDRYRYYDENGDLTFVFEDEVAKYSNNIIDLIEVGDFVNNKMVNRIEKNYIVVNEIWNGRELIRNDEIKSIVTKEQFNACKYVVERDK